MTDQWLVRTAKNVITGPFSKEQLCEQIRAGHLSLQDEVCGAQGYWIYLHERQEVIEQLGADIAQLPLANGEFTQTETDLEVTDPDVVAARESLEEYPDLSEDPAQVSANPSVMSNRSYRQIRARPVGQATSGAASEAYRARTGHMERSIFWRAAVFLLVSLAAFLVLMVFRLLRPSS